MSALSLYSFMHMHARYLLCKMAEVLQPETVTPELNEVYGRHAKRFSWARKSRLFFFFANVPLGAP